MKLKVGSRAENDYGEGGYFELEVVDDNGNRIGGVNVYSMSDCPEDALLCRSLGFVYDIPKLMKEAYNAGKRGEDFLIETVPLDF